MSTPNRGFLMLAIVLLAACESPTDVPDEVCSNTGDVGLPYATAEVVESTPTFERFHIACNRSGVEGTIFYQYRVVELQGNLPVEVAAWTAWRQFPVPVIRVERGTHERVLIWNVRAGANGQHTTSLKIINQL